MTYTYSDIVASLKKSGIKTGDTVFFTTSLGMVGLPPADVNTEEKLNKMFFDAIKSVLGKKGTMLVPAYSYTFGKSTAINPRLFDQKITPSQTGPFSNFFLKQQGVFRSLDPMTSIAGMGPQARRFLSKLPPTSYGEGSSFSRLVKSGAKCCSIGLGPNWVPFIHYADWLYQAPFRYDKFFHGLIKTNGKIIRFTWIYTVRILAKESLANAHKIGRMAVAAGIWQYAALGRARVYTAKCREYFNFICGHLERDKWLLAIGPAADTFRLEEKRVEAEPAEVSLPEFSPMAWIERLSGLRRDIVSESMDAAFYAISRHFPLSVTYSPSGSHCLGWIVPEKWLCRNARITGLKDRVIFSYDSDQKFVRSYSNSVEKEVSRSELLRHINLRPELAPFNYRDWGVCLPGAAIKGLRQCRYKVTIQTDSYFGKMKAGELFLKGNGKNTIIIASYLDGPYKVNASLSGLAASLSLYQWLKTRKRNLNYIFLVLPGEIGFASWLSNNHGKLRQTAGIVHLKCLGLSLKPAIFSLNHNRSLILEAIKPIIGQGSIGIKPSLFTPFFGSDNPLNHERGGDMPQYIICRARSSSDSGAIFSGRGAAEDSKIDPQGIEDSLRLLRDFIGRMETGFSKNGN